jgi:hypothetical protein
MLHAELGCSSKKSDRHDGFFYFFFFLRAIITDLLSVYGDDVTLQVWPVLCTSLS